MVHAGTAAGAMLVLVLGAAEASSAGAGAGGAVGMIGGAMVHAGAGTDDKPDFQTVADIAVVDSRIVGEAADTPSAAVADAFVGTASAVADTPPANTPVGALPPSPPFDPHPNTRH